MQFMVLLKPAQLTLDKDPNFAKTLKLAVQCSLKFAFTAKKKGKHSCNWKPINKSMQCSLVDVVIETNIINPK